MDGWMDGWMDGEERDVLDDEEIIFELIQNLLKGIRGKMRLCVSAMSEDVVCSYPLGLFT